MIRSMGKLFLTSAFAVAARLLIRQQKGAGGKSQYFSIGLQERNSEHDDQLARRSNQRPQRVHQRAALRPAGKEERYVVCVRSIPATPASGTLA